jgi:tyrosinase
MFSQRISRRAFLGRSASAMAALSLSRFATGQTTTRIRLEWQQFKTTPQYASFLNAVRTMKANTNSGSPSSWAYWTNVHVNYCPHHVAYFLAWHRGYLYYFERQLRTVSGDNALNLPYWDYYTNPHIPAEFTDPATSNPLYMPRVGTNVYNALSLSPFASTVWNFQRGTTNAFETLIESAPHDPVHNLIGNVMTTMQSPNDPIFYLHHCNIDRLMHAWALPNGKGIPYTSNPYNASTSSPYWAGSFTYASNLTMARNLAYYPGWLGYDYANDNKPTSLPPSARAKETGPFRKVQAQMAPMLGRPASVDFAPAAPRAISATSQSLGGVLNLALGETSLSTRLPLSSNALQALQATAAAVNNPTLRSASGGNQSIRVVFENASTAGAGANGGYFYNVYLNLPASGVDSAAARSYFLGTLGAFEIAGAAHHGPATLTYPANDILSGMSPDSLRDITLSFARVDGGSGPVGTALRVAETRIEVSSEPPYDTSQQLSPPAGACYC